MKIWEHRVLNLVNVLSPVIFAFILGVMFSAKLFNLNVKLSLVDWVLIISSILFIYLFQKERWNELNNEFIRKPNKEGKTE